MPTTATPTSVFLLIIGSIVFLSIGLYQRFVATRKLENSIDNGIENKKISNISTKDSHDIALDHLISNIWFDSTLIAVLNGLVILFQQNDYIFSLSGAIPVFCWLTANNMKKSPQIENLLLYSAVSTIPAQISYFIFTSQYFDNTYENFIGRLFYYSILFVASFSILLFSYSIYDRLKKITNRHG